MKVMLLSDLHLGKKLNEFSMLDDQHFILQEVLEFIDEHKPDGLIIAGDVYDKATPSTEAVRLLDWFINQVASRKLHLFMISGNHDSADRLAFGSSLFKSHQVHIAEGFREPVKPIVWQVDDVLAHVYLLPFIKPVQVRAVWPDKVINSYDDALKAVIEEIELNESVCNILVAHQYVAGATLTESDDLIIGGLDQVSVSHFDGFDLVALGHLHGPQSIGRDQVRYAGAPLKYSFSEALHHKSIPLITIDCDKQVKTELLRLTPKRDLRVIRGPFAAITDREVYRQGNQEDYVHITLTDELDIPDALNKLRAIYPNIMKLTYDNRRTKENQVLTGSEIVHQQSPFEMFSDFYEKQNNQPMDERQRDYLIRLFDENEGAK